MPWKDLPEGIAGVLGGQIWRFLASIYRATSRKRNKHVRDIPIFNAILDTPANDGDDVIDRWIRVILCHNPALVLITAHIHFKSRAGTVKHALPLY